MRIQDFNPVIKEDNEVANVVTAHGLVNRALNDAEARQEYFEFLQHLRNKHGKDYSTRIHQKAAALANKPVNESDEIRPDRIYPFIKSLQKFLYNDPKLTNKITPYDVGMRVWTRGDGVRMRDPARLEFNQMELRDYAFDLLKDALKGARSTQISGEFPSLPYGVGLVWKGKIIYKMGNFSIAIGSASRITNKNSVWKEKPIDETIVKVGSQYELKSHTGKNLGKYPTKAGAKKREQQVNYFKHVNEAGGNYEELKNRRLRNEDPFVVYDHTLNGVILTSDSLEEATKEAVEWAAYDDITVSVIKKANKRKVLTIDGYSGAMDYYEEHGFPEELDEDAWTGDNPAWHNGNNQWNDGTDQWHSADDGAGGGGSAPTAAGPLTGEIPVKEDFNAQDVVSVDVPLLIRLLEYAREDAKTDMDLHDVTERLIALSQEGNTLTMQDYDTICNTKETD